MALAFLAILISLASKRSNWRLQAASAAQKRYAH
jgi:hypothetical protein